MDTIFPLKISVIIPNHNEKDIDSLEDKVNTVMRNDSRVKDWENIIVNDPKGMGYGHSIKRGMKRSRFNWILTLDADHSYSPFDIPRLINEIPYADMIVGERRGTVVASGLLRSIGRLLVKRYAIWVTGFPIADINSGYRLFHRDVFECCKNELPEKFSLTTTITLWSFFYNFRVTYVPVFYRLRVGRSSLKPWEFFNFIRTINRCKRNWKSKIK